MKPANCVFLACFGLISLISVVSAADGAGNGTDLFLPSQTDKIICPGQANCKGEECTFSRTSPENASSRIFYSDAETQIKCKDLVVRVNYPQNIKPVYQGQDNYTCYLYTNENGTSFNVAELTFSEPNDVNSSLVTCKADNSTCKLHNETNSVLLYVAGLPSGCVPWTPPSPVTPTTPPATSTGSPNTSTSKSDSSTVSNSTGTASTTGTSVEPTTGTNSSSGDQTPTTTAKPGGTGGNISGAIVLVLGAALFARHCV